MTENVTELKRTKAQQLAREPEHVLLGGEDFPVRPLVIKQARAFRRAITEALEPILALDPQAPLGVKKIFRLVDKIFDTELVKIVTLAIPELGNRKTEWIEEHVTGTELQQALWVALQVNFPFVRGGSMLATLAQFGAMTAKPPTKES